MLDILNGFIQGLFDVPASGKERVHCKEKKLREHLSEKQIDAMVECSFPASDPPSTY